MTTAQPHRLVKDDALYFTDNGAVLCGKHLGASARYTYHDISGQRIARVTDADRRIAQTEYGMTLTCECCTPFVCEEPRS